jgi:hypothetical protein
VRGQNKQDEPLAQIDLTGGVDSVTLTVPVSADNSALAESIYELVIGDQDAATDDPEHDPKGQKPKAGAGITFAGDGYAEVAERDPPPPPFVKIVTISRSA